MSLMHFIIIINYKFQAVEYISNLYFMHNSTRIQKYFYLCNF